MDMDFPMINLGNGWTWQFVWLRCDTSWRYDGEVTCGLGFSVQRFSVESNKGVKENGGIPLSQYRTETSPINTGWFISYPIKWVWNVHSILLNQHQITKKHHEIPWFHPKIRWDFLLHAVRQLDNVWGLPFHLTSLEGGCPQRDRPWGFELRTWWISRWSSGMSWTFHSDWFMTSH